jgi:hypothetical protein
VNFSTEAKQMLGHMKILFEDGLIATYPSTNQKQVYTPWLTRTRRLKSIFDAFPPSLHLYNLQIVYIRDLVSNKIMNNKKEGGEDNKRYFVLNTSVLSFTNYEYGREGVKHYVE